MRVSVRNGQRSDSCPSKCACESSRDALVRRSLLRCSILGHGCSIRPRRTWSKSGGAKTRLNADEPVIRRTRTAVSSDTHETSMHGNRAAQSGALLDEPHGEGASRAQFPPSNVLVDRTHRHFSIRITGAGEQRTAIACDERATPGCGASIVGRRCTPVHRIRTNATAIRTSRSTREWCIRFHRAWRRLRDVPLGW